MTADPMGTITRELLLRHLGTWLPAALRQARRATFVQAYQGSDDGATDAALRAVETCGDLLAGRQLSIVTLTTATEATTATTARSALPPSVSVHLLPGGTAMVPVAVTAAAAARSPLFCYADLGGESAATPAPWRSVSVGRPAEVLIVGAADTLRELRAELIRAGFPLVTVVELVPAGESSQGGAATALRLAFATGAGKRIEAFKDALWALDLPAGTLLRTSDALDVPMVAPTAGAALAPLSGALLAHLAAQGRRTVAQLRSFAVTETAYRAGDVNSALVDLLADGEVRRDPVDGRLGGDVTVVATGPPAGSPARSTA
ncbi:hypothetical protein [Micromonospora sp. LOL_023]|uniref:hypothetical protein n=1 Tax=Micromonospora sp. LOL_023 TaxID=3345418 RepID=UPI003A874DC2